MHGDCCKQVAKARQQAERNGASAVCSGGSPYSFMMSQPTPYMHTYEQEKPRGV